MGRRRHQRFKKEMTVNIHGADSLGQPFSQTASVLDVSESGVRLEGALVLSRAGQTVVLEYNGSKARFRVVWLGAGALAGQAGLMTLEPEKPIFNLRFPLPVPTSTRCRRGSRRGSTTASASSSNSGAKRKAGSRNSADTHAIPATAMPNSTSRGRSTPSAAASPTSAVEVVSSKCNPRSGWTPKSPWSC